jgi:hypothetical protein
MSRGQPIVSNGLPLTRLHHAAFDAYPHADTLSLSAGSVPRGTRTAGGRPTRIRKRSDCVRLNESKSRHCRPDYLCHVARYQVRVMPFCIRGSGVGMAGVRGNDTKSSDLQNVDRIARAG